MNNQFATQFLREDREELSVEDLIASLRPTLDKAIELGISADDVKAMVASAFNLEEDGAAAAPAGGGSTTGGGSTAGATFTPGTGEQTATTKAFKKKKYQEGVGANCVPVEELEAVLRAFQAERTEKLRQLITKYGGTISEDAPRLAGDPSKTNAQGSSNLNAYSSVGFTKAPSAQKAGKKIKGVQVKMLWNEGTVEVRWKDIEEHTKKLGRKLHGFKPDSSEEKYFLDYMRHAFNQELITSPQSLLTTASNYTDAVREELNESRAYSKFRKETSTRSKDQQMHEAVKMIHNKLEEVSKLVEFAQQMRTELSEGENTLEYKHNTKKIFEKINSKVIEVYTKTRNLK
jgi:hypothetical protein